MHANAIHAEPSGSISLIGRMGGHGILRIQETFLTSNDLRRASMQTSHPSGRLATLHRARSMSTSRNASSHPPGFLMVDVPLPASVRSTVPQGMRVQMTIRPQAPGLPAWIADVEGENAILRNEQDTIVLPVRYRVPQHGMPYELLLFPVENRTVCRLINTRIPADQELFEFSEPSKEAMTDESRIRNQ